MSSPFALAEIADALVATLGDGIAYWDTLSDEEFFAPIGAAWSPAETVRHLTKSVRAVTGGLRQPRIVLRLLFGRAHQPSRTFDVLRNDYRRLLAGGGRAGRFTPAREPVTPDRPRRAEIMRFHHAAVHALVAAVHRWSEVDADRLRLPHPLLGKLTVREMLLFTLYHNSHHVQVVQRRRAGERVDSLHEPA